MQFAKFTWLREFFFSIEPNYIPQNTCVPKKHTYEKKPWIPPRGPSAPPHPQKPVHPRLTSAEHRAHMCFCSVGETKWSQMYLGSPQAEEAVISCSSYAGISLPESSLGRVGTCPPFVLLMDSAEMLPWALPDSRHARGMHDHQACMTTRCPWPPFPGWPCPGPLCVGPRTTVPATWPVGFWVQISCSSWDRTLLFLKFSSGDPSGATARLCLALFPDLTPPHPQPWVPWPRITESCRLLTAAA